MTLHCEGTTSDGPIGPLLATQRHNTSNEREPYTLNTSNCTRNYYEQISARQDQKMRRYAIRGISTLTLPTPNEETRVLMIERGT
jgi:hypothetical protein